MDAPLIASVYRSDGQLGLRRSQHDLHGANSVAGSMIVVAIAVAFFRGVANGFLIWVRNDADAKKVFACIILCCVMPVLIIPA